jgi:predicted nucleotidyltransferase
MMSDSEKTQSALASTLASAAMVRLLLYFALRPDEPVHVRELGRRTGLAMASLQNEFGRLHGLGLIVRERDGRRVLYRADLASPRWAPFRDLIRQLAQPAEVIRAVFFGVDGVVAAFVFGSQARGDTRQDSDVGLFVVGDEAARRALSDPLSEAESLLDLDVDVIAYTPERLASRIDAESGFLDRIFNEPKQWAVGNPDSLAHVWPKRAREARPELPPPRSINTDSSLSS